MLQYNLSFVILPASSMGTSPRAGPPHAMFLSSPSAITMSRLRENDSTPFSLVVVMLSIMMFPTYMGSSS